MKNIPSAKELCKKIENDKWENWLKLIFQGIGKTYTTLENSGTVLFCSGVVEDNIFYKISNFPIINNDLYLNKLKSMGYKIEKFSQIERIREIDFVRKTGWIWKNTTKSITEKHLTIECIKITACCEESSSK